MTVGLNYLNTILGDTLDDTRPATTRGGNYGEDEYNDETEAVPLQLIFDNIHRMFASEAEAKGLDLRFAKTSLVAQGSAVVLIRILSNLVGNAIKFTASGTVLIGARRRNGKITLQIYDTGQGIAADDLPHITQPYQRATQQAEGYGLGLNIVHKLTAQHGLQLHVKSRPGKGSVFSVSGLTRTA
jgi:signal transduction histidine kinase